MTTSGTPRSRAERDQALEVLQRAVHAPVGDQADEVQALAPAAAASTALSAKSVSLMRTRSCLTTRPRRG
jgi:hypothetical protein